MLLCMTLSALFQELHELVNQEQNIVMQTSNALNQCCGTNSTFAGSAEAVECHRLLLISCKPLCLPTCYIIESACSYIYVYNFIGP